MTHHVVAAGERILRLYNPTSRYRPGPRSFRHNGPRLRFDHHRPAPDGSPINDPKRGVCYAARTISCALVEVFGNGGVIERSEWRVALSTLRDPLQLVDLRGAAAMRPGAVAAIGAVECRRLTQAWSQYGNVHGLIYSSAHNGEDAIARSTSVRCPSSGTRDNKLSDYRTRLWRPNCCASPATTA